MSKIKQYMEQMCENADLSSYEVLVTFTPVYNQECLDAEYQAGDLNIETHPIKPLSLMGKPRPYTAMTTVRFCQGLPKLVEKGNNNEP